MPLVVIVTTFLPAKPVRVIIKSFILLKYILRYVRGGNEPDQTR